MAIQFKVNHTTYQLDPQQLRDKLTVAIESKLQDLSGKHGMARSMVKSAVSGVLMMMGVHNTTGEDTLTFAAKMVLDGALKELEKTGVEIEAEEVKADAKA